MKILLSPRVQGTLLVLLTFAVYWPVLFNGFIWDDVPHIVLNGLLPPPHGLDRIWFHLDFQQYLPMQMTTYWLEYRLWGTNPLGYHIVNVILHAFTGVLLWRVLLRLEVPAAWLCAAVFLVHPVHAETAGYVTERRNLLSALFYFSSMLCWFNFEEREEKRWYAASLFLFLLALLSKTVTCSLPVILLLLRWMRGLPIRRKEILYVIPFFLVALPLALLTAFMERYLIGANEYEWAYTFPQRILLCGHALLHYAGELLWPAKLMFFYPRWSLDVSDWTQWLYVLGSAVIVLGLIPLTRKFGRRPAAALLFFGISIFPASGFANVYPQRFSFVADHFQYIASIGIIVLAVGILHAIYVRAVAASPALKTALAFPVLANAVLPVVLGALLIQHLSAFKNDEVLYHDVLSKNENCWLAHQNLGTIQFNRGEYTEALQHYEAAHRLVPHEIVVMRYLGECYQRLHRDADARKILEQGLSESPAEAMIASARERDNFIAGKGFLSVYERDRIEATVDILIALSTLDVREQKWDLAQTRLISAQTLTPRSIKPVLAHADLLAAQGHFDEALAECDRAAELKPASGAPLCHKAELYRTHGAPDVRNANLPRAEAAFRAALTREPGHVPSLAGLCELLLSQRRTDEAEQLLRTAQSSGFASAQLDIDFAFVLKEKGDLSGAAQAFTRALDREPRNFKALAGFGNMCLQANQDKLAETLLRQALAIAPDAINERENLAIAVAKQGHTDEAVALLKECRTHSPSLSVELNLERMLLQARRFSDASTALREAIATGALPAKQLTRLKHDLAWLLATAPDAAARSGADALRLAEETMPASDATSLEKAEALGVLAAAQAETGAFANAAKSAQLAQENATAAKQPDMARELGEQQKVYSAGQAYHAK
jgi:tetratricopeptide (TPR) repeat protein